MKKVFNLQFAIPVIVLALVLPALTAEPSKPATTDDVQDVVYLSEARPLFIRLHVRVNDKPIQAGWDDFIQHLFSYLDVNGDGVLSKDEAGRVPSVQQLLGGGVGGLGGPDRGGPAAPAVSVEAIDTDKDGKVTRAELAAWYRKNGLAQFQVQIEAPQQNPFGPAAAFLGGPRSEPTVDAVAKAIFNLLDADKDGKLTKEELAATAAVLLRLDEDEDEIVTPRELVPNENPSSGVIGAMQMMGRPDNSSSTTGNKILVPITTPGETPANLVRYVQERYGPKADKPDEKKLSRKDLGLDEETFARLDTNRDGMLDARELAGFVARPADMELTIRLGGQTVGVEAPDRRSPLTSGLKARDGVALLDLGKTRLEMRSGGEDPPDALGGIIRQQYLAQFRQADTDGDGAVDEKEARNNRVLRGLFKMIDRDGDGKITEKELVAYLDASRELQTRAQASCVTLGLSDQSRGVFEALDINRDGRLSVREMRGAVKLLEQMDRDGKGHLTRTDLPRCYRMTLRRGPVSPANNGAAAFAAIYRVSDRYESEPKSTAGPLWFRKMDRNRDGDVSRKEFLFSEEKFRKLDTDGDGLISVEEAERGDAIIREK